MPGIDSAPTVYQDDQAIAKVTLRTNGFEGRPLTVRLVRDDAIAGRPGRTAGGAVGGKRDIDGNQRAGGGAGDDMIRGDFNRPVGRERSDGGLDWSSRSSTVVLVCERLLGRLQ